MDLLIMILWTLVVGIIGVLAVMYRQVTYWRGKGIPYIRTIPIVDLMKILLQRKSLVAILQEQYNQLPGTRYYGFLENGKPAILIKDPEIIRDICVKYFDNFPNHRSFVEDSFDPLLSRNLFSLKDNRWRDMRSTLTPSFTANKMKIIFTLVSQCSTDFVQYLKENPNLIDEFDMKDSFTRFTNDVIATTAFGINVNSMKNRENEFYKYGKLAVSFDSFRMIKFLFAQIFPKSMRMLGFCFLPRKADTFFKNIIYSTIKTREEKGIVRPDMIHLLMQARNNEKNIEVTNDDIVAQAILFFLAGFDVTSRLMCFVSHILAHYPDVQRKLLDEINAVLMEESEITYETLGKMKYLDMMISETLRYYPPMPFIDRVCSKEFILPPSMEGFKEITVQPNHTIWLPIYGIQRDQQYFSEPEKFDPERFNTENRNNINPYAYIPFGLGPRKCIGDRFALMETKILIVNLLQNFIFKPSTKSPKIIEFSKKTFDLSPVNGFWITLEKRK